MGMGRLQRIAALTAMATISVMVAAAASVPALPGLPSTPTVTTPTVTTPTVTVPPTPVTPKPVTTPTVTTPKVTTPKVSPPAAPPKVSAPKVSTPKVTTPKVSAPSVSTPKVSTPKASSPSVSTPRVSAPKVSTPKSSGSSGSPVSKVTSLVTAGGGSGGGGSGGGGTLVRLPNGTTALVGGPASTGTATRQLLSGTSGSGSGAVAGRGGAGNVALDALSAFGGPGGPGAAGGAGVGTGAPGAAGAASLRLPPTLSAAGAKHLRSTLELLEGCMSAIPPLDRQVLGMRAGSPGVAPLSRPQVASRLGVSTRQVRLSERRGLSGLRVAAEQTGCAGPVGGPFAVSAIGPLPLVALATPGGVLPLVQSGAGGEGAYVPARQAETGGAPSPLAGLAGSGDSGPAWLVILFTVLFSVSIAGLMRELRGSVGT
jgi:hypothetical protein